MTRPPALAALALASLAALAPAARADELAVPAPASAARQTNALEIALAAGSAQGYGNVSTSGPSLDELGFGVDLAASWRIDPRWAVGAYGAYSFFSSSVGSDVTRSVSAGLQGNYHFAARMNPWVGLGAGWHGYWLAGEGGRTAYQGLDLARVQAGLSVPVTPSVSIDPVLGATLTRFLSARRPTDTSYGELPAKDLSVFFFAGALVRFDLFGSAPRADFVASN